MTDLGESSQDPPFVDESSQPFSANDRGQAVCLERIQRANAVAKGLSYRYIDHVEDIRPLLNKKTHTVVMDARQVTSFILNVSNRTARELLVDVEKASLWCVEFVPGRKDDAVDLETLDDLAQDLRARGLHVDDLRVSEV